MQSKIALLSTVLNSKMQSSKRADCEESVVKKNANTRIQGFVYVMAIGGACFIAKGFAAHKIFVHPCENLKKKSENLTKNPKIR